MCVQRKEKMLIHSRVVCDVCRPEKPKALRCSVSLCPRFDLSSVLTLRHVVKGNRGSVWVPFHLFTSLSAQKCDSENRKCFTETFSAHSSNASGKSLMKRV